MPIKPSVSLETIIALLMPHGSTAANSNAVRSEILETLADDNTRSRSELLQAARIIALGMTTLDAEAKTADLSPSLRIRYRGNGLNRSTLATEQALGQRLACDSGLAPAPDGATRQTVAHAAARENANNHLANNHLSAGAMVDPLKQMGLSVRASPGG